jgi:anti-sigma regulatory factor (Ser/Thr protein kinase)
MSSPVDDDTSTSIERSRWTLSLDLAEPAGYQPVRSQLRAYLTANAEPESDFVGADIIVAELVGNVVRHGGGAAGFHVDWTGSHPVLVVVDYGRGFQTLPASTFNDPEAESGRGLAIVQALALSFTFGNHARGGAFVRVTLPVCRNRADV